MIKYQVIIFTQRTRQRKLRFLGGPHVVVEQRKIFLVAFNFDYKYLDSGHTRPPVLEKKVLIYFTSFGSEKEFYKNCLKYLAAPSTCVSMC